MKTKYFVGKEYDTLQQKDDIFNRYDKRQQDKLIFLNDLYNNVNTFKSMWSIYNNHIHNYEEELGKDAMFFSNLEVDDLLVRKFQYSKANRQHIYNFIKIYKDWGLSKGYIQKNTLETLKMEEVTKSSKKVVVNKLWGLGDFYNLLISIEQKYNLASCIPLLLARYGLFGKELIELRQLRWEDVDYEKKQVRIVSKFSSNRVIDVDDRFIQWIDKYKNANNEDEKDYGYVLKKPARNKKGDEEDSLMISRHTIDTRIRNACLEVKVDRIALGDLVKARYMDYLLYIRKERKISYDDIDWIQLNFREEVSRTISVDMIKLYEIITGDTIVLKNTVGKLKESLKDPLAKERVEKIIKNIGFEEFVNGEEEFENKDIEDTEKNKQMHLEEV